MSGVRAIGVCDIAAVAAAASAAVGKTLSHTACPQSLAAL